MQRILQPGDIEGLDRTRMPRVRLPEPVVLLSDRAARLRQLAAGNPIGDYLDLVALLVDAQRQSLPELAPPTAVDAAQAERAQAHGMPLIPISDGLDPAWREALRALLGHLPVAQLPAVLQPLVPQLAAMADEALDALAEDVLAQRLSGPAVAQAPLVMAGLQLAYMHRASALTEADVPYAEPATLCPVCASSPVASVLRIGGKDGGYRFLHCSVCATEWHMVRIKCTHCESTRAVRYQAVEGDGDRVVAETCGECHTYRKMINQEKDPLGEPLADDLASITLDLLMGETPFVRASGNPLLTIGAPNEADDGAAGARRP